MDVPLLIDPPELAGPLAGLASALNVEREFVLTIPCDMPFLPDDLPDRLVPALAGHGAALAASDGRVHPVCGLWRTAARTRLASYAAAGRRSLIGFAEAIGYVAVAWPADVLFNVNTDHDLAEATTRLG
jgi:molybdopterin-guanine dinucleotide biosynthesis protein A